MTKKNLQYLPLSAHSLFQHSESIVVLSGRTVTSHRRLLECFFKWAKIEKNLKFQPSLTLATFQGIIVTCGQWPHVGERGRNAFSWMWTVLLGGTGRKLVTQPARAGSACEFPNHTHSALFLSPPSSVLVISVLSHPTHLFLIPNPTWGRCSSCEFRCR